ncbi:MAG: glutamyl-tRNA reductase [Pseudomonadota bacterium]
MSLVVIGLNHKSASVDIRERFAFSKEEQKNLLLNLKENDFINEALVLLTCNRLEIYLSTNNIEASQGAVLLHLVEKASLSSKEISAYLYIHEGLKCIEHIFKVTSSIDSMVVGETQITAQVKDAFKNASSLGSLGVLLRKLFEKSFSTGKRVKTETKIGETCASVSSLAVNLACQLFDDFTDKKLCLIGTGEMAEIIATSMVKKNLSEIFITSRTFENAESLARKINARAFEFEKIKDKLFESDIVITSTGSSDFLINCEDIKEIIKQRKQRPMFFIDISVPRNIEPCIHDIDNVYLYNIDDLKEIINGNMNERNKEVDKANEIIKTEVQVFCDWLDTLDATPLILSYSKKVSQIRENELEKIFTKLSHLSEDDKEKIDYLTKSLTKKISHDPITKLKETSKESDSARYLEAFKRFFNL